MEKITEIAINRRLYGGGKRTGTAIPVGEHMSNIYFNLNNTTAETKAILSQLTYIQTDLYPYPIYPVSATTDTFIAPPLYLFAVKRGEEYAIMGIVDLESGESFRLYDSAETAGINGWLLYSSYLGIYVTAASVFVNGTSISDFMGLPIGTENEKIKNVLSSTPF